MKIKQLLKKIIFLLFIKTKICYLVLVAYKTKSFFNGFSAFKKTDVQYSIFITHKLGGGTEYYTENFINEHKNLNFLFITPLKILGYFMFYSITDISNNKKAYFKNFSSLLTKIPNIDIIFLNSLISYEKWDEILQELKNYREFHSSVELEYFVHDFHCICQNSNLINDGYFCNLRCTEKNCSLKQDRNKYIYTSNIKLWQDAWFDFLKSCDKIITFSNSSKEIVLKAYPLNPEQIQIIPHSMNYCNYKKISVNTDKFRIGIIGSIITIAKGENIVSCFLDYAKNYNTEIFIIGDITAEKKVFAENIHYFGAFNRNELPDIIEKNGINVALFPSIWPETFSYLVSEIIQMDLPLVSFNIGAQGEKTKNYNKGKCIPLNSTPQEIYNACQELFFETKQQK